MCALGVCVLCSGGHVCMLQGSCVCGLGLCVCSRGRVCSGGRVCVL